MAQSPSTRKGAWFRNRSLAGVTTLILLLSLVTLTRQARVKKALDPNEFRERRVELYRGTSVDEFLSLCGGGANGYNLPCPLAQLSPTPGPAGGLKEAQKKVLFDAQERFRTLRRYYESPIRMTVAFAGFGINFILGFYLVVIRKHIDFKLFGREWVFDGTYGFHAKILKRMKFVLKPMSQEEYDQMLKDKADAAERLRIAFEKHDLQMAMESEFKDSPTANAKQTDFQKAILTSAKRQRIIRKKLQQKFDDAKQKYILDERKKFKDEEATVISELKRLENDTKTNGYHRKLLSKFRQIDEEAEKKLREERNREEREKSASKMAESKKSTNTSEGDERSNPAMPDPVSHASSAVSITITPPAPEKLQSKPGSSRKNSTKVDRKKSSGDSVPKGSSKVESKKSSGESVPKGKATFSVFKGELKAPKPEVVDTISIDSDTKADYHESIPFTLTDDTDD